MDLSPEIIDAMRSQHDAMGFGFNPEALSQFASDADVIGLMRSMGLSVQEIARMLIEKITAAHIDALSLIQTNSAIFYVLAVFTFNAAIQPTRIVGITTSRRA